MPEVSGLLPACPDDPGHHLLPAAPRGIYLWECRDRRSDRTRLFQPGHGISPDFRDRSFPNSANNFDLSLVDSLAPEADRLRGLLGRILAEKHRGSITLASRAALQFQPCFEHPDTPLKSPAYVSLSNWFLTTSGDRQSMVATRCENLWDTLFPCRPPARLSSPQPGRTHAMIPAEFAPFWQCMADAQGADLRQAGGP